MSIEPFQVAAIVLIVTALAGNTLLVSGNFD